MGQHKWDEYEAAKLIELRGVMDDLEGRYRGQDAAVNQLSEVLQKYVISLGETAAYALAKRGPVRVRQHLGKIEYLLTDGRAGVKTTSAALIKAADLFKHDKAAYWELLQEANRRMNLPVEEMPIAWQVAGEAASLPWEKYELAALADIYFRWQGKEGVRWDAVMQEFSDKLCCYQEGKQRCDEEILAARDLAQVGDMLLKLKLLLKGASAKSLGAPRELEEILLLAEQRPWAFEELLQTAKKRIPGL